MTWLLSANNRVTKQCYRFIFYIFNVLLNTKIKSIHLFALPCFSFFASISEWDRFSVLCLPFDGRRVPNINEKTRIKIIFFFQPSRGRVVQFLFALINYPCFFEGVTHSAWGKDGERSDVNSRTFPRCPLPISKRVLVQNHSYGNVSPYRLYFSCKVHLLYMKDFTRGLVLKPRHKVTRQWPFVKFINLLNHRTYLGANGFQNAKIPVNGQIPPLSREPTKPPAPHQIRLRNTRPLNLHVIEWPATIVIYLVLQRTATYINKVAEYSEIAPRTTTTALMFLLFWQHVLAIKKRLHKPEENNEQTRVKNHKKFILVTFQDR